MINTLIAQGYSGLYGSGDGRPFSPTNPDQENGQATNGNPVTDFFVRSLYIMEELVFDITPRRIMSGGHGVIYVPSEQYFNERLISRSIRSCY